MHFATELGVLGIDCACKAGVSWLACDLAHTSQDLQREVRCQGSRILDEPLQSAPRDVVVLSHHFFPTHPSPESKDGQRKVKEESTTLLTCLDGDSGVVSADAWSRNKWSSAPWLELCTVACLSTSTPCGPYAGIIICGELPLATLSLNLCTASYWAKRLMKWTVKRVRVDWK